MDSPANPSLPVIELKNLSPDANSWRSRSEAVRHALESYGCLVVKYEEMSSELSKVMFVELEELFGLPPETKRKHTSPLPGYGYGGDLSEMPLFEFFGIDAADTNFVDLLWPDGNPRFSYLERTVMKMLATSYGLEKYYDTLTASSFSTRRLLKYHSPGENITGIGQPPHRDNNFMTVIGTNHVPGLEIETRDGDWISFEPSPNKFIVIVGEALMAWSNGRVYCPLHKVVARGREEKYSIGIFSIVRGVLEVPEELVDDENPLRFKPFNNFDYLDYCKEQGYKTSVTIKEFCGI